MNISVRQLQLQVRRLAVLDQLQERERPGRARIACRCGEDRGGLHVSCTQPFRSDRGSNVEISDPHTPLSRTQRCGLEHGGRFPCDSPENKEKTLPNSEPQRAASAIAAEQLQSVLLTHTHTHTHTLSHTHIQFLFFSFLVLL